MTKSASLLGVCLVALASVSGISSAAAQEAVAVDVDEIVVTANRREERITEVPFAVTAIGAEEIDERGSNDIKDLQYSVPGLNIQELSPGANRTILRGINPGAGTGLPIVGTYVDEVGISVDQQQRDGLFPLVDLERIEVLRGPQGTLYGQGSIAGTIRYITRDPSLSGGGDGFVEANVYSQEEGEIGYRVNGAYGGTLVSERVGLRVAAGYERIAGWIDYFNPTSGNLVEEDANSATRWFIRPKLLIQVTDALSLRLMYQHMEQEFDADSISSTADTAIRRRPETYPGQDNSDIFSAVLSYDFGPATLIASSGYQKRDLLFTAGFGPFSVAFPTAFEQLSNEVRLSSNGDGRIQYTVGAWTREFESNIERQSSVGGVPNPFLRRSGDDPVDSESWAIFGDVTYSATDRLDLSVGARQYEDERSSGTVIPAIPTRTAEFDAFSPRVSARYAWTDDVSSYATISQGFRSGGFNNSGATFGPEELTNYEFGTKALLNNGDLFVDAVVYYLDYAERQAASIIEASPGVLLTDTRNAGPASGFGAELAIQAALGNGFELAATAAYNDVRADVTNLEVNKGDRFDLSPALTASLSLSRTSPINNELDLFWRLDFQHSDAYDAVFRSLGPGGSTVTLEDFKSGAQDYLTARIGLEGSEWGLYFDVANILNEDALLFPNSPIASTLEATRPRPRSFGVTLRRRFGGE